MIIIELCRVKQNAPVLVSIVDSDGVDNDPLRWHGPRVAEGCVEVDESRWPIVRLTYPPAPGPDAMRHYDETLRGFLRRRIPYWTIVDVRALDPKSVSASDRARLAAVIDRATQDYPGVLQCVAVVIDSPVLRMLYTAHIWIRRNKPYPVAAFATLDDAESWVKQLRGI